MNRLLLIILLLTTQIALAKPANLEPIVELEDEYNVGYWNEHDLESMKEMTKLRLETIAENKPKAPINICLKLSDQISIEALGYCNEAQKSKAAVERATLFLKSAYLSDNQKLANFAVSEARKSVTNAKMQEIVNQFK